MSFINLNDLEVVEPVPGYMANFVHAENMTCAYWTVTAGASIPEHSHIHEQIANVIEGEFELVVDGVKRIMKPGQVAVIPSNTPHYGKAITACKLIDIFHPVREDYRLSKE